MPILDIYLYVKKKVCGLESKVSAERTYPNRIVVIVMFWFGNQIKIWSNSDVVIYPVGVESL